MASRLREAFESLKSQVSEKVEGFRGAIDSFDKKLNEFAFREKSIAPEKSIEDQVIERIYKLKRASQGLPPNQDDVYSGLINIKDIREKTRLGLYDVYAHSYMRLLTKVGGEEWGIMGEVATMEDEYFISLEGESRKEAILMKMQTALSTMNIGQNLPVSLPQVQTKPPAEEGKKK